MIKVTLRLPLNNFRIIYGVTTVKGENLALTRIWRFWEIFENSKIK